MRNEINAILSVVIDHMGTLARLYRARVSAHYTTSGTNFMTCGFRDRRAAAAWLHTAGTQGTLTPIGVFDHGEGAYVLAGTDPATYEGVGQ